MSSTWPLPEMGQCLEMAKALFMTSARIQYYDDDSIPVIGSRNKEVFWVTPAHQTNTGAAARAARVYSRRIRTEVAILAGVIGQKNTLASGRSPLSSASNFRNYEQV